jgi:GMP synthase (glutamine-hydrolysing)
MHSALVLQFMGDDGPGYLGDWAARHGLALDVRGAADGRPFPETMTGHGGLVVLGGAMSANDDLPNLRAAERLIEQCLRADIPVLGHCLGGQLMARVLGAPVQASPRPEVGWHRMQRLPAQRALDWFGDAPMQPVFHWHYEAFDLPAGAEALGTTDACPVQAFAIGPHLAMQFHLEIDARKIAAWLGAPDERYHVERRRHTSVQGPDSIRHLTDECLGSHQTLADRVYGRWLALWPTFS